MKQKLRRYIMNEQVKIDNEQDLNSAWTRIRKRIQELDNLEKELLDFQAELQRREREILDRERKVAESEKSCQIDTFFDMVNQHQRTVPEKKRKGIRLSVDWG